MKKKKFGLALGAGSARGFAHLGVLEVFEQHGIKPDIIVGSSMGSVVGGVYSCGTDVKKLIQLIPMLNEKDYFDIIIPRKGGFLRGQRFQTLINTFTKNYDFKDTIIDFACVGVDLHCGELIVMQTGKIDNAIRASIAIPGIFEPHLWNERLMVDGSVISRVPAKTARELGADFVVGVDVGYRGGVLTDEFNGMMDYLLASADIMGWQNQKRNDKHTDIMITPSVRAVDPNSFKDFEYCVEMGRKAAMLHIEQIKQSIFC